MIKFFRKIRYKLMEQNKTGKYLKYAIGEIVLVVIGILIALQINNWNEARKVENSKQALMLALKSEMVKNKNVMERYAQGINKTNTNFNKVLQYSAGNSNMHVDSLKYYLPKMIFERTLSILNAVQEEAISSGKFELLSDSLKQNLSILKDYTNSRNLITEGGFGSFKVFSNNETAKITTSLFMYPEVPKDLAIHPSIPTHSELVLNDDELIVLVKDPETYLTLNKIYLIQISDEIWVKHGLLKLTNSTIELIDKELNTQ